ncbi:biotin/lipoyl-containing protein [Escherichia coli]
MGDKVEAEQSLITVEGDKASMEVPSPQAGIVKEIKVSVGDKTRDRRTDYDFRFRRRCSRRCTCSGRREEGNSSGSSTSGCSGKRR